MKNLKLYNQHKKIIVTTEKDALRLKDLPDLPDEFKDEFILFTCDSEIPR